jgi:tetratricopeptide (TPR) repeat protein
MGNIYFKMKSYEEAIDCYSKVIGIYPNDSSSIYNKGITYKEIGR